MKKVFTKLLAALAAFIVVFGSLGVGILKVLAEQYYGWNDIDSRGQSPYFLYVTPVNDPKRYTEDKYVVYCFNRDNSWPENWEQQFPTPTSLSIKLPIYDKLSGTDEKFKLASPKFRSKVENPTAALVSVLSNGYPTVKTIGSLTEESSRKITQLAIWYFSDSYSEKHFKQGYSLTDDEDKELQKLISVGEESSKKPSSSDFTLDIYLTKDIQKETGKSYQNLLGSTLVPKTPEEPKVPEENKPKEPEVPKEEPKKPEQPENPKTPEQPTPAPQPESPKEEDLGTTIGGGNVVETEEVLSGEQGQSGSTTEVEDTKGPDVMIGGQGQVIETEESLSGEQGQSGSTTEVEDTKGPDVIIGGQGQVIETEEILSGEQGQSGSTTEVEDSKPKVSIHFDNDKPKEEKPEFPKVDTPKAKVTLPATGDAKQAMLTFVGAMLIFLLSLLALFRWKASKA